VRWAMNCGGPRLISCAMGFTNSVSAFGEFITGFLYFFHGTLAAVVSHGLVKERMVPPKEIDRAVERRKRFEANPQRHTYEEA
jgi:hypothetical protein